MVLLVAAVAVVFVVIAALAIGVRLYQKVDQGEALIINKTRTISVTFRGGLVIPVIHRAEKMDIGVKVLEVSKDGADGLICKDNIRADIRVSFYVRVNPTMEDVTRVAQLVGCEDASSQQRLHLLFGAKFAEALKTAGKQLDFVELYDRREQFREQVISVIGQDLNGYQLDDVAIEYLEQTPLGSLNPDNVLDAEGIRKITEITTAARIVSNGLAREAEKQIRAKNVETQQAVYEMDRQEKAAEYRANREMATTKAREESTTAQVEAEERLKAQTAEMNAFEQLGIQRENAQREVATAAMNRQRAVAVEEVKVDKARRLESVATEVETTAAQKDLEAERTAIAQLAKLRIAEEATVAEQEEAIKTLRAVQEANRVKEAQVIAAGAEAEAGLIVKIKAAEADERAADHEAKRRLTLADAARSAAQLEAQATVELAGGTRAEAAAAGLADVEVKMAGVEVLRAEAEALELRGLAQARVKEADAAAALKQGEAAAEAIRLSGLAEGAATEAKLKGEAAGLADKAEAMRALEGVGQEYDLAVKRLDADVAVRTAAVEAQRDAAVAQAQALGASLASAKIDIVGGTDMFVDRVLNAVNSGRTLDAFTASETVQGVAGGYLSGEKDLIGTAAGAVAGLGASGVMQLSLAKLLTTLAAGADEETKGRLDGLLAALTALKLDGLDVSQVMGRA